MDQLESFVPKDAKVTPEEDNLVKWANQDSVGHTVTLEYRTKDLYSKEFVSDDIIKSGEVFEFLFTHLAEIPYYCKPRPQMSASMAIEKSRF